MKVKIVRPFAADSEVGAFEQHYGVTFQVTETSSNQSVLVADLDEEEAQAMLDAGRVDLDEEEAQPEITRDEMKAYLTDKGVDFPANIPTAKLAEMYAEAKAE